jgi:probable rRNA maturation factor
MNTVSITLDMEIATEDEDVPEPGQIQQWLNSFAQWLQETFGFIDESAQLLNTEHNQQFSAPLARIAQTDGPLVQFLKAQQDKVHSQISLIVTSEAESRQLNLEYRQKDRPTNVLSFPGLYRPQQKLTQLGDLVICAKVVMQEARAQHKSPDAHWAHLLLHGFLHLLGFDHEADDEAHLMETLERLVLLHLNFPDPYAQEGDAAQSSPHIKPKRANDSGPLPADNKQQQVHSCNSVDANHATPPEQHKEPIAGRTIKRTTNSKEPITEA